MHEMSIAESVLDAVRAEAQRRPNGRVVKVGLKLGELAGVDRDALSFCFEAMVAGTDLEPLALEIESCPRRNRCPACGSVFAVSDYDTACPNCGAAPTEPNGGDELELAWLELEEP